MRMKNIYMFTLLSFIIFSYFSIYAQESEVNEVLESIGLELTEALLSGDYETIISHFTDDVIVFPIFDAPIKGKRAYREAVKKLKEKGIRNWGRT